MQTQPTTKPPKKIITEINNDCLINQTKKFSLKVNECLNKLANAKSESYYLIQREKITKLTNHINFLYYEY